MSTGTANKVRELAQGLTLENLRESKAELKAIVDHLSELPQQEANEVGQEIEGFRMAEQRLFGM